MGRETRTLLSPNYPLFPVPYYLLPIPYSLSPVP